jgi:anti-sigma regulatory factor (Ser/Thr protein kinase)
MHRSEEPLDALKNLLSLGARQDDFRHEALFYGDEGEFMEGVGAFVRDGVAADEPIMVLLGARKVEALRSKLASDADRVSFTDTDGLGGNPARIIPAWREFVDAHSAPGRRLRGVGEPVSPGRSPAELVECQRHESLLNLAFADAPGFYLLCPYDTGELHRDVLFEARRSHPCLSTPSSTVSSEFRGLEEIAAPFREPLAEPPAAATSLVFQASTVSGLRHFVRERADSAGLSRGMTEELVLAASEIAANSVLHGGGGGILRTWEDGDALICEVCDAGLIADPLVGRKRPAPGQIGGRGVWLANQLCDLVQLRTDARGSAVRLHKHSR